MKGTTLTLRQVLNQLSAQVTEELTEEQLLDLPINVRIPHSCGQYSTLTPIYDCNVKYKKEYSKAEQRVTVVDTWIDFDTNPVT